MLRVYMKIRPFIKFMVLSTFVIASAAAFPVALFKTADPKGKARQIIIYSGTMLLCYFFPAARIVTATLACILFTGLVICFSVDYVKHEKEIREQYGIFYGLNEDGAMRMYVILMNACNLDNNNADLDRARIINEQYMRYLSANR